MTMPDLRAALSAVRFGDSVRVEYEREGRNASALVVVGGYAEHDVRLVDLPDVTDGQHAVRRGAMLDTR